MLKKIPYLILGLLSFLVFSCADDDAGPAALESLSLLSVKTLGGSNNDAARSVISTSDGGYAVAGFTQSNDGDVTNKADIQYDFWLLKFTGDNELVWQKTYGGSNDDRAEHIIQTNDGGFAIIGYNNSNDGNATENAGGRDIWIIKTDSQGEINWQQSIGFSGNDQGLSVIQTNDGGYFIGGIIDVTASGGEGNKGVNTKRHAGGDYWGLKLNASGQLEWRKFFGGFNTDTCYDVTETDDGYLLIGSSDSNDVDIKNNKGSYDIWLVKIDKTGSLVWEKSLGGSEIDEGYQLIKSGDNNFVIAGETRSNDQDISNQNGGADVWIVKINPEGDLIWQKTFGGSSFDVSRGITQTNDGFALVGSSRSSDKQVESNNGQNDVWVLKLDTNGNLKSQKVFGGSEIDFGYGITQLADGTLVVVGESASNDSDITENKGFTDLLLATLK